MTDINRSSTTPAGSGRPCPSCQAPMAAHAFKRQLNGEVSLDLCFGCQGIWFDEFESAQLAPAGVLELFRLLHEHHADPRQPWRRVLRCPRCRESLLSCLDSTRTGRFAYSRCPQRHGRYSSFSAFMVEKGFVRQLNGAEVADLARKVQTIRCSGCGAPVDIRRDQACTHCRSPIVILDPDAVRNALAEFGRKADQQERIDPHALADALIANERARVLANRNAAGQTRSGSWLETDIADLVGVGIDAVWTLLRK
ncbi:zf-TFIIB domain-containing protein [Accumulibacter sp.]|uniref:zf-TFIIB domain-containing protein n=1 Tax=Accumulibacter sp. TaxID=2053492 RepID=UPI0025F66861|nr:zf-TFIIB domain-containing protein [Accumulibacter sp.]MDS4049126.1 zf-TFIIB domain-containing protein [Accumulibacter sp.]